MQKKIFKFTAISLLFCASAFSSAKPQELAVKPHAKYVIIYVWDGLRPDSVTQENTPNLYNLMQKGTQFLDNHATYPSFTMMNAASFATGDRAGKTGFFGNTLWHPGIQGNDAAGNPVDFNQPVFTEDYKILQDLNKDKLLFVNTLFEEAHKKQLNTVAVGKSGPAFMQDYLAYGITLDEKHAHPLSFAKQLQKENYPLPKFSPLDFEPGDLILAADNGSPTDASKINFLSDGVTPDPSDDHGSPYNHSNEYMMKIYLDQVLKKRMTQLSVIWMRNPDTTEHNYGPGTINYKDALRSNDNMLASLLAELKNLKMDNSTDIIIVSDHSHSSVSGPVDEFPLRNIKNHQVGNIDKQGYSVSGDVRSAALLTDAGFHAYDGVACVYNPVLSGIKADNTPLLPTHIDETGNVCGKKGTSYITKAYKVPTGKLPEDAVIVAANGGTVYFYVPSHNKTVVENVVTFLASHQQYDAIFIDDVRYGKIPGTVAMSVLGIENPQGRSPDIIAGFSYDENTKINNLPGIEFSDTSNTRGMHGSFSPIDVHNFLMAYGPDFRSHFKSSLPSGNVDVAPTVAYILGLSFPENDGRILSEALVDETDNFYKIQKKIIQSDTSLNGLTVFNALNQKTLETQFSTKVYAKILTHNDKQYYYFDKAKGERH